jgi:[CysO sulfur-carrier protein]-S-L-cysteine hydrolase
LSTPFCLQVPRRLYQEMLDQARAELPNECCGLLAGIIFPKDGKWIGRVVQRYALVNAAAAPKLFESEPKSHFAADKDMRRCGTDMLAVYHSHPTSAPVPSKTDLERNYSTEVVNLIISLAGEEPQVRGWWLTETDYREAEWVVLD